MQNAKGLRLVLGLHPPNDLDARLFVEVELTGVNGATKVCVTRPQSLRGATVVSLMDDMIDLNGPEKGLSTTYFISVVCKPGICPVPETINDQPPS